MPLVPMRMNEQFQYMKLKMATPIESAPMAVASPALPIRPAMAVEAIPISGTVMFDMMLGTAKRMMSLFILRKIMLQRYIIIRNVYKIWHTSCESCVF